MIFNLFERWKQEWWLKHAADIAREYAHRQEDLVKRLETEINDKLNLLQQDLKLRESKLTSEISKGKILEEEVAYRTKILEDRKLELIAADNELRTQIKLIEAKAHPSSVYIEAFSQGMNKCWDMLLPIMSDNIEKLKTKMKDDAITEAIQRLKNAPNKK